MIYMFNDLHGIHIKEIVNIVCRMNPLRAWQPIRIVEIDGLVPVTGESTAVSARRLGVGSNTSCCKGWGANSRGRCWACPDHILLLHPLWLEILIFIIRNWFQGRNRFLNCIRHRHEIFSWRLCWTYHSTTLSTSCGHD